MDYKDITENASNEINERILLWSMTEVEVPEVIKKMPCGYSCPNAFSNWYSENFEEIQSFLNTPIPE